MPRPLTPALSTDIIIELLDRPGRPIVLVRRAHPPAGWAIPGGFVEIGERVEDAARREAREETGLDITLFALLGCYSDPHRDARGHTVSICYVAHARGTPRGGDDAAEAVVVEVDAWPAPLAFDHAAILRDYAKFRSGGYRPLALP